MRLKLALTNQPTSFSRSLVKRHICDKCRFEWICLTQTNYGCCDDSFIARCYNCSGSDIGDLNHLWRSKTPLSDNLFQIFQRLEEQRINKEKENC